MHFHSLDYLCQYGGLYVFFRTDTFDYDFVYVEQSISLCTSIYSKPTIPFHKRSRLAMARIYLIFTAFHKYSTGYMEVSLMQSDCEVYNLYFYAGKPDGSIFPRKFSDGSIPVAKNYIQIQKKFHIAKAFGFIANMDVWCRIRGYSRSHSMTLIRLF